MTGTTPLNALKERYGEDLVKRVETLCATADKKGYKIATAESATAGGIAHLIASVNPNVLARGNVTYNNRAKVDLLGVDKNTLDELEAVCEPVANQMAQGALAKEPEAQISVSVTGYAGPWGDESRDIPGGTVFVGAGWRGPKGPQSCAHGFQFDGARTLDIRSAIVAAVGALEVALEEKLGHTPEGTIEERYNQSRANDTWLTRSLDESYALEQSGEPADPLLQEQYDGQTVQAVQALLSDCIKRQQTIAVVGDASASEICHVLTTINGSSKVVDRGQIVPSDNKTVDGMVLEQQGKPARLIVATKTQTDGSVKLAIATNLSRSEEPRIVHRTTLERDEAAPTPRQVAVAALEGLQAQVQQIRTAATARG